MRNDDPTVVFAFSFQAATTCAAKSLTFFLYINMLSKYRQPHGRAWVILNETLLVREVLPIFAPQLVIPGAFTRRESNHNIDSPSNLLTSAVARRT